MVQKVAVLKISNLALHVDIVIRGIQFQHNALFLLISNQILEWNFLIKVIITVVILTSHH